MRRRDLISLLGSAAVAWPFAARAQPQAKVWHIGFLGGSSRPASFDVDPWSRFLQGMRELGYVEGKNLVMEWRFAEGRYERFPELATELVRLKVDVILVGPSIAASVAQQASSTIPIVITNATDPIGQGLVASLAHPGGNVTGLASSSDDTSPKQLELLAMAVPNLSRVGFLANPDNPSVALILKATRTSARKAGLALVSVEARNLQETESAFTTLRQARADAIMIPPDAFMFGQRERLGELALKAGLPSIFWQREYVVARGLMSYGENLSDFYWRAASYVDKILKGAKPAELPVEQPTRFFLVINLKTAKTLGLEIPPKLLALADEVIE